jgi:hypothetical protein
MKLLIIFHLLFIIFLISLFRTLFANPGFFTAKFQNTFSLIKFVKNMFHFFISYKDGDFKMNDYMQSLKEQEIPEDLEEILKMERQINEKMLDYSTSGLYASKYNSIDVTKKSILNDGDDEKEKDKVNSIIVTDDVIELYDMEWETFIKYDKDYNILNKLPFLEKDSRTKRICSFCVQKKVFIKFILARPSPPL